MALSAKQVVLIEMLLETRCAARRAPDGGSYPGAIVSALNGFDARPFIMSFRQAI